jgi:DNA-binding YbaB/EbfC family protein
MMNFNYQELMKQAQAAQRQMEKIQEELKHTNYEASSGGGAVKVKVNGDQEVLEVNIDRGAFEPADIEMLQDMVLVALNDAIRQSKEDAKARLMGVTGGMSIPGF